METEVRLEGRLERFGVDGAVAVLVEAIPHHPLEPGEALDLANDALAQLRDGLRVVNDAERPSQR